MTNLVARALRAGRAPPPARGAVGAPVQSPRLARHTPTARTTDGPREDRAATSCLCPCLNAGLQALRVRSRGRGLRREMPVLPHALQVANVPVGLLAEL